MGTRFGLGCFIQRLFLVLFSGKVYLFYTMFWFFVLFSGKVSFLVVRVVVVVFKRVGVFFGGGAVFCSWGQSWMFSGTVAVGPSFRLLVGLLGRWDWMVLLGWNSVLAFELWWGAWRSWRIHLSPTDPQKSHLLVMRFGPSDSYSGTLGLRSPLCWIAVMDTPKSICSKDSSRVAFKGSAFNDH